MKIQKEAAAEGRGQPSAVQLDRINALAKTRLNPEQVYVFSLRLCDDGVDRDFERFDTEALPGLAKLFIGKTGIVDHRWSAENQIARIFDTQVVREKGVSYIKAWAYTRRGGGNEEFIADIEAGIKKEVSVGCAMGSCICSICGAEYGTCGHCKGESYDGQLCCGILRDPVDAYEFSFVAVPAQREAGVIKAAGGGKSLKELADQFGAQAEYRTLYKDAQLGKQYRKELEQAVVRLGLALELGADADVLQSLCKTASAEDLMALRTAWQEKLDQQLPLTCQLLRGGDAAAQVEAGYLI